MTPEEELESIRDQRALHLAKLKDLTARRKELLRKIRLEKRLAPKPRAPIDEAAIARQQAKQDARWAQMEEAFNLRENGFSYKRIGEHFGISGTRASQIVHTFAVTRI